MLNFQLFHRHHKRLLSGGIELLETWSNDADTLLWLDIDAAIDESTAQLLQQQFGLHPLAIQDASRDRHPPKIEGFDKFTLLIFKGLAPDSETIDCRTIQISLFVGDRFLVSRHSSESFSINRLKRDIETDNSLFEAGPGAMAVRLSRLIVDRYLNILLALEPRLEFLEESLMGQAGDTVLAELVRHKSDLTRLQRTFYYHSQVIGELNRLPHPGFSTQQQHQLNDVFEHQQRAASLCNMYYQLAADLIDGYISLSSHRLNQIMRILTIITAIFVPLSFLAGIYGMNFDNMPELHSSWGYFGLITLMAVIAGTLLLLFYRMRWFR